MRYKSNLLYRAWINQPSELQILHKYHGKNVLAQEVENSNPKQVTIYFTSGEIISMLVPKLCISEGWESVTV